jgi:hypothetical protein
VLADLADFLTDHRPRSSLAADATPPAWNGYLLTVSCGCGVVFERRVTPWELLDYPAACHARAFAARHIIFSGDLGNRFVGAVEVERKALALGSGS